MSAEAGSAATISTSLCVLNCTRSKVYDGRQRCAERFSYAIEKKLFVEERAPELP